MVRHEQINTRKGIKTVRFLDLPKHDLPRYEQINTRKGVSRFLLSLLRAPIQGA